MKNMLKVAVPLMMLVMLVVGVVAIDQLAVIRDLSDLPSMEKPKILVKKADRTLEVYDGVKLIKAYKIALGSTPEGDKEIEGDGKTPEGSFYIFTKNPRSKFYLSLGVSYPSAEDAARGVREGLISQDEHDEIVRAFNAGEMPPQKTELGGEIYIHGSGNLTDWTEGCIAMKNSDMRELYDAIEVGTPVEIVP